MKRRGFELISNWLKNKYCTIGPNIYLAFCFRSLNGYCNKHNVKLKSTVTFITHTIAFSINDSKFCTLTLNDSVYVTCVVGPIKVVSDLP